MTLIEPLCAHGHRIGCTPPDNCPECMEDARRRYEENTPFIRTLRKLGGVKPCGRPHDVVNALKDKGLANQCALCHGTGQILDLTPLLAKPKELLLMSFDLTMKCEQLAPWYDSAIQQNLFLHEIEKNWPSLHLVGPQRAHSLVYEIARQLGGMAVVAIDMEREVDTGIGVQQETYMELSIAIPDNATVLFVTDRIFKNNTDEEIIRIIRSKPFSTAIFKRSSGQEPSFNVIPSVLALTSGTPELDLHIDGIYFKVVALHEE